MSFSSILLIAYLPCYVMPCNAIPSIHPSIPLPSSLSIYSSTLARMRPRTHQLRQQKLQWPQTTQPPWRCVLSSSRWWQTMEGRCFHATPSQHLHRLVNLSSYAAVMSLHEMSSDLVAQFKNPNMPLVELDQLMSSYLKYASSPLASSITSHLIETRLI